MVPAEPRPGRFAGAAAAALVAVAVLATVFAVNQAEARKESNRRLQESRLRVATLDYEF